MGAVMRQPAVIFGPAALAFLSGLTMLGGIGGIVAASMSALTPPTGQVAPAPATAQAPADHQADETATAAFINQVALSHVAFSKLSDVAATPPVAKPASLVKKVHPSVRNVTLTPPPRPLIAATPLPAPATPAANDGFSFKQLVPSVDYLPSPRRVADDVMKQAGRLLTWQ